MAGVARHQAQASRERQRPEPGVLVQGEAVDELHREERLAVLRHRGLEDLRNAGVAQAAEDLHLLGEALQ